MNPVENFAIYGKCWFLKCWIFDPSILKQTIKSHLFGGSYKQCIKAVQGWEGQGLSILGLKRKEGIGPKDSLRNWYEENGFIRIFIFFFLFKHVCTLRVQGPSREVEVGWNTWPHRQWILAELSVCLA